MKMNRFFKAQDPKHQAELKERVRARKRLYYQRQKLKGPKPIPLDEVETIYVARKRFCQICKSLCNNSYFYCDKHYQLVKDWDGEQDWGYNSLLKGAI